MGTRGSALALAQSGQLAQSLKMLNAGLEIDTVVIKTSGDVFAAQPPSEARALAAGAKGLFVKEIEEALLRGEIDFAVHSAKDLPAQLAPGLSIGAYPRREDPRDAFISRDGAPLAALPAGARIASSSLRRQMQLRLARPGLTMVPMRGNVDTRLRKMAEGACDGLVLAAAGLKRLGKTDVKAELIPVELMIPAPGQGALAVEVRENGGAAAQAVARIDDPATRLAVEFERALLQRLGGGCSTPLGAHAVVEDRRVSLSVFLAEQDGSRPRRLKERCDDAARREAFVDALARKVLA